MPLAAAAAYAQPRNAAIMPSSGGAAFCVDPHAPITHTQCVRPGRALVLAAGVSLRPCPGAVHAVAAAASLRLEETLQICFRYPYVTGTSVLAIKYADGVMMASDMLGVPVRSSSYPPRAIRLGGDSNV